METRRRRRPPPSPTPAPRPPPSLADCSSPEAKRRNNTSWPAVLEETYSKYMDELDDEEEEAECRRLLAGPPPQEIMISFVDRLVRAHQFFEFRDYLENECQFVKTDSKWKDVFLHLIRKPERNSRFNKLDEETIMDAIYERIRELQANEVLGMKLLGHPDYPPIPEERRLEMYHQYKQWRQVDHIPFSDPTLGLINRARKEHLLDHNPQVELDKIKECDPLFYDAAFVFHTDKPLEYSEKTVMVVNLTTEHTDEKLIDLLSVCGEVEKIERTSSFVWPVLAHVTFKNSEAARIAPFVVDPHLISVCRMCDESFSPESVEEKVEEDVGSIYKEALLTYRGLCLHYALQHVQFTGPWSSLAHREVVMPPFINPDEPVRNLRNCELELPEPVPSLPPLPKEAEHCIYLSESSLRKEGEFRKYPPEQSRPIDFVYMSFPEEAEYRKYLPEPLLHKEAGVPHVDQPSLHKESGVTHVDPRKYLPEPSLHKEAGVPHVDP